MVCFTYPLYLLNIKRVSVSTAVIVTHCRCRSAKAADLFKLHCTDRPIRQAAANAVTAHIPEMLRCCRCNNATMFPAAV